MQDPNKKKPAAKPAAKPKAPAKPRVTKPKVATAKAKAPVKAPAKKPTPKGLVHGTANASSAIVVTHDPNVTGVPHAALAEEHLLSAGARTAFKVRLRDWFHDVDAKDKGGLGSDPAMTDATRASISFYQKWKHLKVTGALDKATVKKISPPKPDVNEELARALEHQISLAVREVGYNNGPVVRKYLAAVGLRGGYAWCAAFQTWLCTSIGDPLPKTFNRAYVPGWIDAARQRIGGLRIVSAAEAVRGNFVCFDWQGDGVKDHIGQLLKKPRRALGWVYMTTGEGNTGPESGSGPDGVYRKSRVIRESRLTFISRH